MSPIFSTQDYTGLEVESYDQIQKTFGTKENLKKLIETLNEKGMSVTLHFPIDQDVNDDKLLEHMQTWSEELKIEGYYISNPEAKTNDFWKKSGDELEGTLIAESDKNADQYLENGFDLVHDRSTQDELTTYFKQPGKSIQDLLDASNIRNEQIIQSMDFYDTDRFTHQFAETGSHPITYWKLALTYLLTIPNDTLVFQGSEIPLDGVKDDLSHHQLMNFLAGEDQLIRHMEKISNAYDDLPSLSKGKISILHADDSYLVFKRTFQNDSTIVAINTSQTQQKVDIELEEGLELRGLLKDDLARQNDNGTYTVAVDRESSNIFNVREDSGLYWPLIFIFAGVMAIFIIFAILMYRKNKA